MLRRDPDGCTLSITTVLLRRGLRLNHEQYLYITNREIQEAPLRVSHLQSYGGKIKRKQLGAETGPESVEAPLFEYTSYSDSEVTLSAKFGPW